MGVTDGVLEFVRKEENMGNLNLDLGTASLVSISGMHVGLVIESAGEI